MNDLELMYDINQIDVCALEAQQSVLEAQIQYFNKVSMYTEAYAVVNPDRVVQEYEKYVAPDTKQLLAGAGLGINLKDENGKIGLKSILRGLFRVIIAGIKRAMFVLRNGIYYKQMLNTKCTHVKLSVDLDKMQQAFHEVHVYMWQTLKFYKGLFGTDSKGKLRTFKNTHELEALFDKVGYHFEKENAKQMMRDLMSIESINAVKTQIETQLKDAKPSAKQRKMDKISEKALKMANDEYDANEEQKYIDRYRDAYAKKHPDVDMSAVQSDEQQPDQQSGDDSAFKFTYLKNEAIKKFKELDTLTKQLCSTCADLISILGTVYNALVDKANDGPDTDMDDYLAQNEHDSVKKLIHIMQPSLRNITSVYTMCIDYAAFATLRYGMIWLPADNQNANN